MNRRSFGKLAAVSLGVGMMSCATAVPGTDRSQRRVVATPVFPPSLREGDLVGLVAPASPFSEETWQKARQQLESLGFPVKEAPNLHARYGFLAGSDERRVQDIHEMFSDPEIKGIWCLRGGYGTSRILPLLDYELIRNNPKVLIGYSDITALLQGIRLHSGLVGFHGPVAASTLTEYTRQELLRMLTGSEDLPLIRSHTGSLESPLPAPECWIPGKVNGELAGGNLSLLAALAGTKYALDATGKILFIEDVGEKPYRIDRMLTQLIQSAKLDQAAGIVLGMFSDCEAEEGEMSLSLRETLRDRLMPLNIPLLSGFSFGHVEDMCTFPVGVEATLDCVDGTIQLNEFPVRSR